MQICLRVLEQQMVTVSSAMEHGESLSAAKDRVQTGPVPGWVEACPFPIDCKARHPEPATYLLFDRQIHAELRQTYFHVALRLDTEQAVQNQSSWQLDFEPRQQQVTLHWIKTWREGELFEQADLSTARVADDPPTDSRQDRLTLLLRLEDLQPGDILEWCYTIESRPLLLPEYCASLFTLPAGGPVGRFYFSLLFNSSRPMQWKSSVAEWHPVAKQNNDEVVWIWTQENYEADPPEKNTPDWHIAHPWIQISDCPDWGTIAAAFAEAWKEDEDDVTVREIAEELATAEGDIRQRTKRAIQLVQEEYAHLAVLQELDGQPPTPSGIVASRRYGSNQDLSFLLVHLLRRLGVPARLVLVNTVLRKSLAQLLPAPGLFNHLLVEYQVSGETRWVEAAPKVEDGSPLPGAIRDYGAGLPVTGPNARLVEPPDDLGQSSAYELNESILLDTSGAWSWLAVVVAARGRPAEALREELERDGLEVLAKNRLRDCADRFIKARRVGPLQYRDDRAANEFFLAEIFEINDFLTLDPKSKWYRLDLANNYIANSLKAPGAGPRRAALVLSHTGTIAHTIELHSVALASVFVRQRRVQTDYLSFTQLRKTLAGYWTMKLSLSTLADSVPAESLDEYRETIKKIRAQSTWSLLMPPGDRRPHQRRDFGVLPNSWNPPRPIPTRPRPLPETRTKPPLRPPSVQASGNGAPEDTAVAPAAAPEPARPQLKRRKRYRQRRVRKAAAEWPIVAGCALALTLILILILVTRNADHWNIFRKRPAPPATPVNTLPVQ